MKTNYLYYVVDPISETVVGTFPAINDDMAKRIVSKSFETNKNLESIKDVFKVYRFGSPVTSINRLQRVITLIKIFYKRNNLMLKLINRLLKQCSHYHFFVNHCN